MVGELTLATTNQSIKIELSGETIRLILADFSTAWGVSKQPLMNVSTLRQLLSSAGLTLQLQVGGRKPIELFPKPSWILRLLSPLVRELVYSPTQ